ncbi:MAG: single-stranded-DNA-specific exonuclease RecJ [Alphaproteobacteria bacterium]|nr:single-stranded-DNA-specific exonuclease RecJ [Alphaproteobacteria bacterium]
MSDVSAAYLGVECSVGGKRWRMRGEDDRLGLALAQRFDLPEAVGRVMAARGISLDDATAFLHPVLKEQLPDPSHLNDMDAAVTRLVDAVRNGEMIGIFGDYDVDGATSSALLSRFFAAAGGRTRVYIPDRIKEGYGPNAAALERLAAEGISVVVTVDCGITAFEPLETAASVGLEVIVVDHHVAEPRLPTALAVINPNRLDDDSPYGQLAAVGVSFLLAVAVNRGLREAGCYDDGKEPDLRWLLDLVALGTVCDVVPLTGLNRVFVRQGLAVMARRRNLGIAALADVAGVSETPEAYHAGFVLGPRVNAGGRVGEAGLGATLLTTSDSGEATRIAKSLDDYNKERRAIEAACLDAAIAQVEGEALDDGLVYVAAEGWHPGVIGIVASRLKDRYNRPACVVAFDGDIGKGSGRSVRGVDLGVAVVAARQSGLLVNGGGHPMAAGFTVERGAEAEFRAFLAARIADDIGDGGIVAELGIDGSLQPRGANVDFIESLEQLSPFGAGNARPRFVFPAVRVLKADVVGRDHVRCFIGGEDGARIKGIAFRATERPLGQMLLASGGLPLHIAGHLQRDRWQGRDEPQLIIEDAAKAV